MVEKVRSNGNLINLAMVFDDALLNQQRIDVFVSAANFPEIEEGQHLTFTAQPRSFRQQLASYEERKAGMFYFEYLA